ncbi:MAG: T9SS type A sorting domain-containing protein [Bacteroidetes bacterium]|nr:T9SS type A sorting domain-containing protein [Bacteroidota bacterium]
MKNLLLFFLLLFKIGVAQNLVLNGDFEDYYGCPTNISQLDSSEFWITPTLGTSDYFNQCNLSTVNVPYTFGGYQQAYSGVGFAGIFVWNNGFSYSYREYIEVPLSTSLSAGVTYNFDMKINLSNACVSSTYDIGAYFSDTIVSGVANNVNLPFVPQINNVAGNFPDSLNWISVTATYTASGGESFLIIGNFKNNPNTYVTDSLTTTPIYVFIDDVYLAETTVGIDEEDEWKVSLYPNPTSGSFNLSTSEQINDGSIEIYNVVGELILSQKIINQQNTIDLKDHATGLYFLKVISDSEVIGMKKVVKE